MVEKLKRLLGKRRRVGGVTIGVGVAYAIWSGLGTALIAAIGIFAFREPVTALKLFSIALIIAGVVGLNLGGGGH